MKIGEVAKRTGLTPDAVRFIANSYPAYFSQSAAGKYKGSKRAFSEQDCRVTQTVARMRNQGLTPDQISEALDNGTLDDCPESATEAERDARDEIALVPMPEYERQLDRIRYLTSELETARTERDRAISTWQTDTEKYTDRIAKLERELGEARGEIKALRPSDFWLKVLALAVVLAVALTALIVLLATRASG